MSVVSSATSPAGVDAAGEEATVAESSSGSFNFFEWLFNSDGFHAPTIGEFFPPAIFGEGTLYEFNRIGIVRIVAAIALITIFWQLARRARVVPGRGQAAMELLIDFVRVQLIDSIMSKDNAKRFGPFLITLFFSILFFNLTGVIPLLNMAGTALIGLPVVMAVWVYLMYLGVGVKQHGLGGYLKMNLFPAGVPWFVYPLLTPIEFLQVFILRPATLALRLAANMMAGHLLLVLCFAATHFFFLEATGGLQAMGAVSLLAGLGFTLFEIFVAFLQAYVFVILSSVYLNMAVEDAH